MRWCKAAARSGWLPYGSFGPSRQPQKIEGLGRKGTADCDLSRFVHLVLVQGFHTAPEMGLAQNDLNSQVIAWSDTPSQVTSIEADDYTYNSAMKSLSATGDRARVVDPVDQVSSKWGDRHEISNEINSLIDVFSKTRCEALVGYANGLAIWRVNHGWAAIKPFWLQIIIHNHTCGYLRILFV
jgi:hypothetical protein